MYKLTSALRLSGGRAGQAAVQIKETVMKVKALAALFVLLSTAAYAQYTMDADLFGRRDRQG
jgi:hypothetical protein